MAAGLVPKEPQYGDIGAMRQMGVKYSPESNVPTFFKPQGGRPPTQAGQVPVLGGTPAPGSPPTGEQLIPAEHQDLIQRSVDLAAAARSWAAAAALPTSTEKVRRIALALKEAARIAASQAREGTPFTRGS